jgi:hypothetical protein
MTLNEELEMRDLAKQSKEPEKVERDSVKKKLRANSKPRR